MEEEGIDQGNNTISNAERNFQPLETFNNPFDSDLPFDKPVSISEAMNLTTEARVICSIQYPYGLLHANKAWTLLMGYHQHELQGKSLEILQGAKTNMGKIRQMMQNVKMTGFGATDSVNYTKAGVEITVFIRIQPIMAKNFFGDRHYSHLLGRICSIPATIDPSSSISRSIQQWEGSQWMITNTLYQLSDTSGESGNNDSVVNSDSGDECNNSGTPSYLNLLSSSSSKDINYMKSDQSTTNLTSWD